MYYECSHDKVEMGLKFCPSCAAPAVETMTYAEAEVYFKIPEQTIRAAVRNNGLTEMPQEKARIVKKEIQALKNDGKIGRGPTAKKMKRKRFA